MAAHEIPADELDQHTPDSSCPCCPGRAAGLRPDRTHGVLYLHAEFDPGGPADVEHTIPDDGAPHSRSNECGCGPARFDRPQGAVYVHIRQRPAEAATP